MFTDKPPNERGNEIGEDDVSGRRVPGQTKEGGPVQIGKNGGFTGLYLHAVGK